MSKRCVNRIMSAPPVMVDPYDMRIMVRALYTSGLTDDMTPVDRRKAALRLRSALQEQSLNLAFVVSQSSGATDE